MPKPLSGEYAVPLGGVFEGGGGDATPRGFEAAVEEWVNLEVESLCQSISHELRSPLRAVEGFSRALLEDYGKQLDGQGKQYLEQLRNSARHMEALIDGLLTLASAANGELYRTRVDLTVMAGRVADRLRATDPGRDVAIVVEESLAAHGDSGLLEVAIENLLGNAWKFTSKCAQARIEFASREVAGSVVYFVRDNGAGFDMRHAPRLFGPFQRLHSNKDYEGTGIGLALVQRIIHRHGGRIWPQGEVNRGATFYFTLQSLRANR